MKRISVLALIGLATITLLSLWGCGASPPPAGTAPPATTPAPQEPPPGAEILAPGVWKCPDDLTGALYVSSVDGDTYYKLDCGQAQRLETEDRICFATSDAARDYGYGPCGSCP